jgi:hypothetical protein
MSPEKDLSDRSLTLRHNEVSLKLDLRLLAQMEGVGCCRGPAVSCCDSRAVFELERHILALALVNAVDVLDGLEV